MEQKPVIISSVDFKPVKGERSIMIADAINAAFTEDEEEITMREINDYLDQRAKRLGINRHDPNYKSITFIDTTETLRIGLDEQWKVTEERKEEQT